jgi:uncharacterized protein (DUF1778 family)
MEGTTEVVTSTRLTPDERRVVEAGAKAEGLSLSAYIRAVLVPASRERLLRQLGEPGTRQELGGAR